jgi:NADH dehydrogenase
MINILKTMKNKQHLSTDILILGAGIGGYTVFDHLANELKKNKIDKTITIVDQNNYFTFTPLLHEVASGSVEPQHATISLRELIYKTPHHCLQTKVERILPQIKTVQTGLGDIHYEYCIIALGSGVNFYNILGAKKFSYSVRTLNEALHLRNDLIKKLENSPKELIINIIGGGYTGVEVAGQLSSLAKHDLKKLYPQTKIDLNIIQSASTIAPQLPKRAQEKIINRLKKLGVKIFFNSSVDEVREDKIILKDQILPSDVTVWCAGVDNFAANFLDVNYCERGRLSVNEYLQIDNLTDTYAIGDIACGHNQEENSIYPQIGEVAQAQGKYVAKHLISKMIDKNIKPFHFKSKGTLMPIGDNYGVVVLRKNIILAGFFAWWLRRTVYLVFMPGKLRKIKIVINWTLNLFGFKNIVGIGGN